MTLKEACKVLGKSDKQVRRYINHQPPLLTAVLVGKQYFITRESVDQLRNKPVQVEDTVSRRLRQLVHEFEQYKIAMSSTYDQTLFTMGRLVDQNKVEMGKQIEEVIDMLTSDIVQAKDALSREFDQKIAILSEEMSKQIAQLRSDTEHKHDPPKSKPVTQAKVVASVQHAAPSEQDENIIYVESERDLPDDVMLLKDFGEQLGIHRKTFRDYVVRNRFEHYGIKSKTHPRETKRYVTQAQQEAIKKARGL